MEDLQDMKAMWQELNERVSQLEAENRRLAKKVVDKGFKSARERLMRKYKMFICVECIFMFWMSLFLLFNPLIVEKYRIITMIYWTIFFLGEAAVDFYLLCRVKKIDVFHSTVNKISREAAQAWKIHKIAVFIGLPLAIGAIILYAFALDANKFTIYGMIVGGMVGLIIGGNQLLKFMKYYRQLQSDEE